MTLYDDLGVAADASPADLKAAHRQAVKASHPDAGGDADAFQRVTRAWLVLSDPAKRARYDETGRVEDAPDNSAAMVRQILVSTAMQVIGAIDPVTMLRHDMAKAVRDSIKAQRQAQRNNIDQAKRDRVRIELAAERFGFKGPGDDVIGAMLQGELRAIDDAVAAMTAQVARFDAALALAAGYDWRADPDPMAGQSAFWPLQSGGTVSVGVSL